MSIYTNAVYRSRIRKFANDNPENTIAEQEQLAYDQEMWRLNSLMDIVNNPKMVTADRIKAAYELYQSGKLGDVPLKDIIMTNKKQRRTKNVRYQYKQTQL